MNFEIEEVELLYEDLQERTQKTIGAYKHEISLIRAGRANAHILDDVKAEYYGTETPLNQLGNITIPEARMLVINVWDTNALKNVEKAIIAANLGLNPINDGKTIRLVFPAPTEERRKQLVKELKQKAENAKVAIRNIRREELNELKKLEKDKVLNEDLEKNYEAEFDKVISGKISEIDKLTTEKESEIMTI
ncbi:MAG: ribosome recycling factor [Clostridia bacterium]|nr:ribosome recycling factor [Clostridia bacterium]